GGDKLMTRYEMAQIVAKAMAKGANVDKLAAEFADELDNLGVRVANLEKKADNVKISGETKLRYWAYDGGAKKEKGSDSTVQRTRVWIKGAINEDWTYSGMLENIQTYSESNNGEEKVDFQRAYVNGKIGGVKVQAGRSEFADMNSAMIYDTRWDGVFASYGKDVKLTVGAGKGASGTGQVKAGGDIDNAKKCEEMYSAELVTKIGVVDAKAGYYQFNEVAPGEDDTIWTLYAALPVAKDVKVSANYLNGDRDKYNGDDDGFIIGVDYKGAKAATPGTWGVWAKYYDMGYGTYIAPTFEAEYSIFGSGEEGFKGYGVGANYTFAKNIVGAVKYYDLEAKKGDKDGQTLYAELNFMF
ncbi:MAG: hypothetical protein ACI3WU_03265, partial [Phascolarctobacterium sp.]